MAVAGLVVGGVSLATVYSSCIQLVDLVCLARGHGRDFEIAATQAYFLEFRLAAWGRAVRADVPGKELEIFRERWPDVGEITMQALGQIESLFGDVNALSEKYGVVVTTGAQTTNVTGRPVFASSSRYERALATSDSSNEVIGKLKNSFEELVAVRQKSTSITKKTVWAVHDKKKFDELIRQLDIMISNLEVVLKELSVSALELQRQAFAQDMQRFKMEMSDTMRSLFQDAAEKSTKTGVTDANTKQTEQAEFMHRFIENEFDESANVVMGNVGETSGSGHHYFGQNKIGKDSNAVLGNVPSLPDSFFQRRQ